MIKLYQFAPAWGLPNPGPFCFKVEAYLRMAELEYETRVGDPRKAPKKKLPYIDDGGRVISDSTHIIEHLKRTKGDPLDAGMTSAERATAHATRRMVEEGLYFCLAYWRWIEDDAFAIAERDLLRPVLPPVIRSVIPRLVRRQVKEQLRAQGTGRHTRDEIFAMGRADLDCLSETLGEGPYFGGAEPRSIDATMYAFLAIVLWSPPEGGPLNEHVKTKPNLVAYCERMKARYWA